MSEPFCFVLMPFGEKVHANRLKINFDAIYRDVVAPAIKEAEMEAVRAKEAMNSDIIEKPTLEQLILSEYVVADLTSANGSVLYELGVRHAVRPDTTIFIFSEGTYPVVDLISLGALAYSVTPEGLPRDIDGARVAFARRLKEARSASRKYSIYDFVENYTDIGHTKTDVFREKVDYSAQKKIELAEARKKGVEALRTVEMQLGDLGNCESGVIIDLFLSYRALSAWQEMIDLVRKMPRQLASTVMVQEQLGLALNRIGKSEEAEEVLKQLLNNRGPSSETYSILGRVYKDRWEEAQKRSDDLRAKDLLEQAIEAYRRGFEADWRDALPGINTVTLMELREPPDPRREQLLPVVSYAVERRIADGKFDYWDQASRVELSVLSKDKDKALAALSQALAVVREPWEPETTARNLRLIREARERRNETVSWAKEVEDALDQKK